MQTPALRPRSAGEILDAGFQFMRAEYAALVLGMGAFVLPPILLEAIMPSWAPFWSLLGRLLWLAGSVVPVVMVTDFYLGKKIDIPETLRIVTRRFGSIWGASFISGFVTMIGLIVLVVPGIIAAARLFAMPTVVLTEGKSSSESFERSRELTRDYTVHILCTLGVAYLIVFLITVGLGFAIGMASSLIGVDEAGIAFFVSVMTVGIQPYVGVVSALLYIDLRVRKEAFDIQLMADALGGAEEAAAPA